MKVVCLTFACLVSSVLADTKSGEISKDMFIKTQILDKFGTGAIAKTGVEVTKDTFFNMTAGYDHVFLKFCKADNQFCAMANGMFGRWQPKYKDSIADVMLEVDCDGKGASLCHALGVFECKRASPFHQRIDTDMCDWFPVFKKGDPLNCTENIRHHDCLQFHNEGPDPIALEQHYFKPRPWCRALNMEKCTDERVEYWKKLWNSPVESIEDLKRAEEMKLVEGEDTHKRLKKKLAADMKEFRKRGASKEEVQGLRDQLGTAGRKFDDDRDKITFYGELADYKDIIIHKQKGQMHEMARDDWTEEKMAQLREQQRKDRTRREVLEAERKAAAKKATEEAEAKEKEAAAKAAGAEL